MHEVSPLDILVRANEIVGEFGLTRGAMARLEDGTETYQLHPNAMSFCSVGVISRAAYDLGVDILDGGDSRKRAYKLFAAVAGLEEAEQLTTWNDRSPEEQVRAVFTKCGRLGETERPVRWVIPIEETIETIEDAVLVA